MTKEDLDKLLPGYRKATDQEFLDALSKIEGTEVKLPRSQLKRLKRYHYGAYVEIG